MSASRLSFGWLIRLRWTTALALALGIVLVGPALHLALPATALLAVVAAGAVTNLVAGAWARVRTEVPRSAFAIVLGIDTLSLSLLLYFSGGSHNPFVAAYLLLVVLAATLLGRRAAFATTGVAAAAVFTLTLVHIPLRADHTHPDHTSGAPHDDHDDHDDHDRHGNHDEHDEPTVAGLHPENATDPASHVLAHAQTVWIAFPILAALTAYLISSALKQRDLQLAALETRRQRAEHLAELGVIAAAAAHELGSPLSTIAVVAKDLERAIEAGDALSADDARLIRKQVQRCREALDELAHHAEQEGPRTDVSASVGDILDDVLGRVPEPERLQVNVGADVRALELSAPRRAIGYVLRGIVENAYQASPPGELVHLAAHRADGLCRIEVEDAGDGMTAEDLARAGNRPFARRRSDGSGLGVGLFLSRAVVENVGGELSVEPRRPRGTRVALSIPLVVEDGAPR